MIPLLTFKCLPLLMSFMKLYYLSLQTLKLAFDMIQFLHLVARNVSDLYVTLMWTPLQSASMSRLTLTMSVLEDKTSNTAEFFCRE